MIPMPRKTAAVVLFLLLIFAAVLLTGCASGPRSSSQGGQVANNVQNEALADRLYARLQEEHGMERDRASLRLAYELLDHYQGYAHMDHVSLIAARSARSAGSPDESLRLSGEFMAAWPDSPHLWDMMDLRAELLEADRDWPRAADALVRMHDAATLERDREKAARRLAGAAEHLDADALRALRAAHPGSGMSSYLGYLWIQRLVAEERGREAHDVVVAMRSGDPDDPWLGHAELLLDDPSYEVLPAHPTDELPGDVDALHVGVLVPLTGRYTVLGNAFFDGVQLARDQANREGWRHYILTVRDSEGDPVAAAMAMRAFAAEQRPIAVIGGLLSAPTVAAALTAESFGIPLISPTATNERIQDLGRNTFQTNVTSLFEARLLARLAVDVMLKKRVAIVHPDEPSGMRSAEVFAEEILALGGELVAIESFNTGLTDFRDPLQRVADSRPEVIFVPVGADMLRLLGPQLDFYRTGALILGPSTWNNPGLAEEVGTILERAVFPSDTALYPPEWSAAFDRAWSPEGLPAEASAIARQAYLAAMLTFHTLGDEGMNLRTDLSRALNDRLELRREAGINTETMGPALRMFSEGRIVPFPIDLFREGMARAAADTSSVSPPLDPEAVLDIPR